MAAEEMYHDGRHTWVREGAGPWRRVPARHPRMRIDKVAAVHPTASVYDDEGAPLGRLSWAAFALTYAVIALAIELVGGWQVGLCYVPLVLFYLAMHLWWPRPPDVWIRVGRDR